MRKTSLPKTTDLSSEQRLTSWKTNKSNGRKPLQEVVKTKEDVQMARSGFATVHWSKIALIIDDGVSMVLWQKTLVELQATLKQFTDSRNLCVWKLATNDKDQVLLFAETDSSIEQQQALKPEDLFDPKDQWLVLVASDCVSPAWYSGKIQNALEMWGRSNFVTLVQVLPRRLWPRTALGAAAPIKIQVPFSSTVNERLKVERLQFWFDEKREVKQAAPMPVLTLEPSAPTSWIHTITNTQAETDWIHGVLFGADSQKMLNELFSAPQEEFSLSAKERVQYFRAVASPIARKLAGLLAAAPINFPFIQHIQETMLPESHKVHVAEIFLGGLLTEYRREKNIQSPDAVEYDFISGVRDELLNSVPLPDAFRVLREASYFLARREGHPRNFYTQIVTSLPSEGISINEKSRSFVAIAAKVWRRLGGVYVNLAENLERQLNKLDIKQTILLSIPEILDLPGALPSIWNIPYQRNSFFIGRENLLMYLHEQLFIQNTSDSIRPLALTGLGGIGKTQIALEYAYRHRDQYYAVFWVQAASRGALITDLVKLADMLHLPERNAQDQAIILAAVKRWLTRQDSWLLIVDNADGIDLVRDFLPNGSNGHILVTTRNQSVGTIIHSIEVEKMNLEEGALLLLRQASILANDASLTTASQIEQTEAANIVKVMDGLPLALAQAGTYIEETGYSLSDYLKHYERYGISLLRLWRSKSDYPETLTSVWASSFLRVEQTNQAAIALLRLCAFLDSDTITVEIFIKGAFTLDPELQKVVTEEFMLNEALEVLRQSSLIHYNPKTKTLSIHRLVQEVLKESMDNENRYRWAENAVRVVNAAFPQVTFPDWNCYLQYLPQVYASKNLIDKYNFGFPEAAQLLNRTGMFLCEHAQYEQSEPLISQALTIREHMLGAEHPDTAQSLNDLAALYKAQGRYEQAQSLCQRALTIREHMLGAEHPDTAQSLNDLAALYKAQGQYKQAETFYQRALIIRGRVLGAEHPDTAQSLNDLAALYKAQGRYEQAQSLCQRALTIREHMLGAEHPDTAQSLNNLATLYRVQEKYDHAKPLHERALAIRERILGAEHPATAQSLNNLAVLYHKLHQLSYAKELYQRALAIRERVLGAEHPDTAQSLNNLAALYRVQGSYELAESHHQRALAIRERILGAEHPDTAQSLNNLAALYHTLSKYEQAKELYERALTIRERILGAEHPDTVQSLNNLAAFYETQGQFTMVVVLQLQVGETGKGFPN